VHGVSRGTRDLDLFTLAHECLDPVNWAPLEAIGVTVRVRRGDTDDPLAGKSPWQAAISNRARPAFVAGVRLPVATARDLVLLKLYGGGPQDAWDIEQLLTAGDRGTLIAEVEGTIASLPPESRDLWRRISQGA